MKIDEKHKWLRENGFTEDDAQKKIGFHWHSLTLIQIQRGMLYTYVPKVKKQE